MCKRAVNKITLNEERIVFTNKSDTVTVDRAVETFVVVVSGRLRLRLLLPSSVHHGVDFVEAVGADEARDGAEMAADAERVALAVEVG